MFTDSTLTVVASSGEYVPVLVDHSEELPCRGQYYLHHGLQRRIRITLVHEATCDLKWKDVRELVVGRIRSTPESDLDDDLDGSVLSLGLFPGKIFLIFNIAIWHFAITTIIAILDFALCLWYSYRYTVHYEMQLS